MYHRDHAKRFVAALNLTPEEGEKIKQRAETAIAAFSSKDEGLFSGAQLEEVLGSAELVGKFNDMWEKQRLVQDH